MARERDRVVEEAGAEVSGACCPLQSQSRPVSSWAPRKSVEVTARSAAWTRASFF